MPKPLKACFNQLLYDKQLVSHDPKSNDYNFIYTFFVEICPICREDLICLPPQVSVHLGNLTLKDGFLGADKYWTESFKVLFTSRQQVEYIVLDVKTDDDLISGTKYVAKEARVSDFGKDDTIFCIRTHLGHLLKPGDYALGYDLYGANLNDIELDKHRGLELLEAILVKKSYEEKRQRKKRGGNCKPRSGKLKTLDMEVDDDKSKIDQEKVNTEYEQFLEDLEENPDLRFNISLYRNKETDGQDVPSIPLE